MQRIIKRNMSPVRQVKYDAIVGADLHIREDVPICRTDDYLSAQFGKMFFIQQLCKTNNCLFLCAGDLLDAWKPSPWLLTKCLELLPVITYVCPGQHDLAQHSLAELPRTGLQTLAQAGRVFILSEGFERVLGDPTRPLASVNGYAYGEVAKNAVISNKDKRHVLLWHHLTCIGKQPWPGAGALQIDGANMMGYDLVVSGDNHKQFLCGHWLNPGSMMRMDCTQKDFQPAVYGWNAKNNTITRIPLPIKKGVVNCDHLNKENKIDRDVRMEAYIRRAQKSYETKLSYTENLKRHIKKTKVGKEVEELVWEAVEAENKLK